MTKIRESERAFMRPIYFAVVGASILSAAPAWAETYAVLPFRDGGELESEALIFTELLASELSNNPGSSAQLAGDGACYEAGCAADTGASIGAEEAIHGSMARLGERILVNATLVDVATRQVVRARRLSVARVEQLEPAAARLAAALVSGETIGQTAELGNVLEDETEAPKRRAADSGFGLSLIGLFPVSESYAGGGAIGFSGSYWFEATEFALEPRIGIRWAERAESDSEGFTSIPIDINAYYLPFKGDFAPFFGGGAGVRYLSETLKKDVQVGPVLMAEHEKILSESKWGFGVNARAGLMFFRTYTTRAAVGITYDLTFMEINGRKNPQALLADISVYF